MPKLLVIVLLTITPSQQLMALEFNRSNYDIQPESISCEVLKEYFPEINCFAEPNQPEVSDAPSEVGAILIESINEPSNLPFEEEPYAANGPAKSGSGCRTL